MFYTRCVNFSSRKGYEWLSLMIQSCQYRHWTMCAITLRYKKMLRAWVWLNNHFIQIIFNSIVISELFWALPTWSGFANKGDQTELTYFWGIVQNQLLRPLTFRSLSWVPTLMIDKLFKNISSDDDHVFIVCCHGSVCDTGHNLWNPLLPAESLIAMQDKYFLNWVLYKKVLSSQVVIIYLY